MKPFLERLQEPEPMVYDGGFGSQLFARGIELTNSSIANESHPEAVVGIHRDYIGAGVDAIGTNTFVASALHLKMADREGKAADRISVLAAEHAKAAVEESGKDIYIAGSIGPSPGAIEADSGGTDFGIANAEVRDAHERVVGALAEGGVDFFVIETQFSAKEAAMAVDVARQTGLPIAVNMTYKYTRDRKTGEVIYRTDWGHSAGDLLDILASGEFSEGRNLVADVQLFGLNCGAETRRTEHTGMPYAVEAIRQTKAALKTRGVDGKWCMAYPNAGMPYLDRETRQTLYSQTSEDMAQHIPDLIAAGASLIGGCCGTTPDHIRAFRRAVDEI
ncbi:MAG: homocysteine S-methyltransferase family protein [bacterium]|nr:homocysteine S-methyltransferase family protein [bacterium]